MPTREKLIEFLKLRKIEGNSKLWLYQIEIFLEKYLDYVKWKINKETTLEYISMLQEKYSIAFYKKNVYQIKLFLAYLGTEWQSLIKLPNDPEYVPKRVALEDIRNTLTHFEKHQYYRQIKAIVLLGTTSGMRAEELYQLQPQDIDIEKQMVKINHNPNIGQTTKTQRSRISFFNQDAKKSLSEYLEYFNNGNGLGVLFGHSHLSHLFRDSPVKIKDFRKFFSQEWDRRGGPTSIKKILMGHSVKSDVDLQFYNFQSEDDLKKIYDRVMNDTPLKPAS